MQYITYAIYKHQRPCATADQDSAMDDNAEGPSATKKQKIEDREAWESRVVQLL